MTAFEEAMRARKEKIVRETGARNEIINFLNATIRKLRDDVEGHGGAIQVWKEPQFTEGHVKAVIVVKFPASEDLENAEIALELHHTDQADNQTRYELRANDHRADVKSHEQGVEVIYGSLKM